MVYDKIGLVGEGLPKPCGLGQKSGPCRSFLLFQKPVHQGAQTCEALGHGQFPAYQRLDFFAGQLGFGHSKPEAEVRGQVAHDPLADGYGEQQHRSRYDQEQKADLAAQAGGPLPGGLWIREKVGEIGHDMRCVLLRVD